MQVEHTYDRLVPVTIFEVDGTELRTPWRTGVTIGDNVRASIEFLVQFQLPLVLTPGCDLLASCIQSYRPPRRSPQGFRLPAMVRPQPACRLGNDRYLRRRDV